jgi:hypothetical protein
MGREWTSPSTSVYADETMTIERIRPSTSASYDVNLNSDRYTANRERYALQYTNLDFTYVEERVREGSRGYIVVSRSKPERFRIAEGFGGAKIYFLRESEDESFYLQVDLDRHLIEATFGHSKALPYGVLPVQAEHEDDYRSENALIGHLQRQLVQSFEIDAIRAVRGEFFNTEELESEEEAIVTTLRYQWRERLIRSQEGSLYKQEDSENGEIMSYKDVLIFSSPIIYSALQSIGENSSFY